MRLIRLVSLFVAVVGCISLLAQTPTATPPPPQSARQALLEMFLGKGENDFTKHLPETANQTLIHKGDSPETNVVLKISTIGRQMVAQGERLETFETGPNLLISQQNDGHEKYEIAVEHDTLLDEDDEIELSVHYYKDGQLQSLPVVPRLIFTLRQEKEVWRLTEVTAAVHAPLTDPDYLKGLRKDQNESNETAAQNRVTVLAMAEGNYAARHPDRGYACTVAALVAAEPGAMPGESGFVYDPGQGNEEWSGYRFALTGCDGTPAAKYRITAVPIESDAGIKTFCADESGAFKFVTTGKSSSCFSRGQSVNSAQVPTSSED
ncbi:MAG TPA: hypothetical protein VIX37_06575 [Candidatus Sulfotelmatobacter sp.]